MSARLHFLILTALTACSLGCAGSRSRLQSSQAVRPAVGIVFVTDGAGNFQGASRAVRQAVAEQGLPLCVETVEWSHGFGRIIADQVDYAHSRDEGCRLAHRIAAYRQSCPCGEVYLIGYSAGSPVVLAAAEALPANSVDHVVLLAPSVSECYDLRCALNASRGGIDVFYSDNDRFFLGFGTDVLGTSDRLPARAAGRVGFQPRIATPSDAVLYARLRQHPWDACVEWTGNHGGHYGSYEDQFLRAYVLPLLSRR